MRWRRIAGAGALLVAVIGLAAAARSARAADEGGGWLGVYTQDLTSDLREGIGYRGDGALVSSVVDGSPADEAGIRKGDVVVRYNNRLVDDASDLTGLVQASDAGQRVTLLVHRDGSNRTLNVTLGERPADAEAPRARSWSWSDDGDDAGDSDTQSSRKGRTEVERDDDGDDEDDDGLKVFRYHGKGDGPHVYRFDDDGDVVVPRIMGRLHDLEGLKDLNVEVMGRGRLGVQIQDLNEGLGEYFDTDRGVLVTRVIDGSAADEAGLKAGDVITRFDGKDVEDADDLMSAVRGAGEGPVDVTIVRKGETQTLRPTLEKQRVRAWSWGDRDPKQLRDMADRARERAERARERAERLRDRDLRGQEQDVRGEMQRLREELRELERRLERLQEDEE
jgi:membrane-associated protease RseP (regulator of RpoE activity)